MTTAEPPPPPLAIEGGTPLRATPFPPRPTVTPADDADPARALEAALAARLGLPAECAIAFGSPEDAWQAAFAALEVARGDDGEVVVPALYGERIAEAAWRAGLHVVPGEVESETANLGVRGLEAALSERTALVGVVHAHGHPAEMDDLLRLLEPRGVPTIEDATDALGASLGGEPVGRLGAVTVFVLRADAPLTGGATSGDAAAEAGALLVAPDPATAERARAARTGAQLAPEVAAVALAELRGLDAALDARRRAAWELTFAVRHVRGIATMPHGRWVRHAYARYVFRMRGIVGRRPLDECIAAIRAEGIPCEAAAGDPLHLEAAARASGALEGDARLDAARFAIATRLAGELVAIPLHEGLTQRDVDDVAAVLRKVERWST